jgi:hypothetical protein
MPGRDDAVYLAKLAEQAERYEGVLFNKKNKLGDAVLTRRNG